MTKPLVLIIEDDNEIRKIFTLILETHFEVESFEDGYNALARLDQVIPAVIILDLNLPGISGKDILTKIRKDERLVKVPVIIATADVLQAASLETEADLVLIKPISPMHLRNKALQLISSS